MKRSGETSRRPTIAAVFFQFVHLFSVKLCENECLGENLIIDIFLVSSVDEQLVLESPAMSFVRLFQCLRIAVGTNWCASQSFALVISAYLMRPILILGDCEPSKAQVARYGESAMTRTFGGRRMWLNNVEIRSEDENT